ncbi:cupin domain-containing protein [Arenibacter sp. F20364]|uniref:cupin domain-containing protein n=1 Tax=Arenibacter sp. F20364 TaxID=2926415 RepID=UPI001FF2A21C|nr:cupin domain-containing protein [Arenibacter sp. F20364]MCK0189209.1 cupin domain-containing protein [Arenibacter sp. F20364]
MNNTLKYSQLKVVILILTFFASFSFFGQGDTEEVKETSLVRTHMDKDLQWGPCPSFMPEGCTISVLHGDPAKNNVDVFFKVPANYVIPEHWHSSVERMILVSGELHVTYEGEEEQIMKVGSYAFGPATKPHTAKCGDKDPCVLFIGFEEPLDAFPMVLKE